MTIAPLRPDPVIIDPNALKTKSNGKRLGVTLLIATVLLLAVIAAVYIVMRTVRKDESGTRQQQIESQQDRSKRKQSPSTNDRDTNMQTRTNR